MKKTYLLKSILILIFQVSFGQSNSEISITRDGIEFKFTVSCDNGPCQTGQFVNGDYWVVPNSPNGAVIIHDITPHGTLNGAMVNPDLLRDGYGDLIPFNQQKQGLLSSYSHYDSNLDLMTNLPYEAHKNESIIKIAGSNQNCGTTGIDLGCVQSAAILTILESVPDNFGVSTFRPPFHGNWKPLYTTDKVRMERLPSLPQATNIDTGILDGENGFEHWLTPQIELYHNGMGEFHRAMIPHLAQPSYAADQALLYLEDITSVFGTESIEQKRMAVYSLIQKGIDNYGVFKMGVPFNSGAAQHVGKKPPIVFFAALYDDETLLEEIRNIASDEYYLNSGFFQEDAQIRMGNSNMAIWGDFRHEADTHWYFTQLYPNVDKKGTIGDPYGYIDGPAGGIHPNLDEKDDRNYLPHSSGVFVGYSLLQHLMPWFKHASNDFEILQYSDRIYDGYGIDNFDGGLWTLPDPVARYDTAESEDCKPFKLLSTGITECSLYGQTWGPNLNNLSQFIGHNQDPNLNGRMPELHGTQVELTRIPKIVRNHWTILRPCSDPESQSYPCQGLGSLPEDTVENPDIELPVINAYEVYANPNSILFNTSESHNLIIVKIYRLNGLLVDYKIGIGKRIQISRPGTNLFESGIYIYNLNLDGEIHSGKIVISSNSSN
ncbi:MAG: hypothetical protein Wins2KO_22900 [Winogradskyella sp.]